MGFIKTGKPSLGNDTIVISSIPSNKGFIYAEGFTAALKKVATMEDDPEWVKGYEHGVRVRDGLEEKPDWLISKNDNL